MFLQLVRKERTKAAHAGEMNTRVTVRGFHSERYAQLSNEFVQDRKDSLGLKPTDMTAKAMQYKVRNFYDMCFSGETTASRLP